MGVNAKGGKAFTADSMRIAPGMRTVFARLMAKLAARKVLTAKDGTFTVVKPGETLNILGKNKLSDQFTASHPGFATG